jgi:hypothetical protein
MVLVNTVRNFTPPKGAAAYLRPATVALDYKQVTWLKAKTGQLIPE